MRISPLMAFLFISSLTNHSCKTPQPDHNAAELRNGPVVALASDRMKFFNRVSFQNLDEFKAALTPEAECSIVNMFVEIGPTNTDIGHSAVGIDYDFYDYGPGINDEWDKASFGDLSRGTTLEGMAPFFSEITAGTIKASGSPWWDHPKRYWRSEAPGEQNKKPDFLWKNHPVNMEELQENQIGLIDVLREAQPLSDHNTTVMIPISVSKKQASDMRAWWDQCYANAKEWAGPGTELKTLKGENGRSQQIMLQDAPDSIDCARYRIPGWHCTSTSMYSFDRTRDGQSLNQRIAQSVPALTGPMAPFLWLSKLLDDKTISINRMHDFKHQCGRNKGGNLKGAIIVRGAEFYKSPDNRQDSNLIPQNVPYYDPTATGLISWLEQQKRASRR